MLIVDDEKDICALISNILTSFEGIKTSVALNGEDALVKLRREHYDLVILDYKLGKVDGFAVLEEAGQLQPGIRVIMMSGHGDAQTKEHTSLTSNALGSVDFIGKPFGIKSFVEVLENALRKRA